MENQHRNIKGYRELSQQEIDMMNNVKELAAAVGEFVDTFDEVESIDKRWTSIGRTDLQKGFMALTRAIARPEFF